MWGLVLDRLHLYLGGQGYGAVLGLGLVCWGWCLAGSHGEALLHGRGDLLLRDLLALRGGGPDGDRSSVVIVGVLNRLILFSAGGDINIHC